MRFGVVLSTQNTPSLVHLFACRFRLGSDRAILLFAPPITTDRRGRRNRLQRKIT